MQQHLDWSLVILVKMELFTSTPLSDQNAVDINKVYDITFDSVSEYTFYMFVRQMAI